MATFLRFFRLGLVVAFVWAVAVTLRDDRPVCLKCGRSGRPVPIRYGYPSEESLAEARAGEVELGGCSWSPDSPTWYCKTCGDRGGRHGSPGELVLRAVPLSLGGTLVATRLVEWAASRLRWRFRRPRTAEDSEEGPT